MWRKIYSEMLKKRKQKWGTRLCDRVIMREWAQNKSHHHVYESRTISKSLTWCKLTITPIRRALVECRNHLVFGHNPQMLTSRVVRMLYPRNMEHIEYQLRCDNNARTSNVSMKERYWRIKSMHVGVKLLDQYGRTSDRDVTQWLPIPTVNDIGKVSVGEVCQNDSGFWMNTLSRKVLREVLSGILIMKSNRRGSRIRRRWCSERRGFQDGSDLSLGAIDTTNVNRKKRERERQSEKSQHISNIVSILKIEYICIGNA